MFRCLEMLSKLESAYQAHLPIKNHEGKGLSEISVVECNTPLRRHLLCCYEPMFSDTEMTVKAFSQELKTLLQDFDGKEFEQTVHDEEGNEITGIYVSFADGLPALIFDHEYVDDAIFCDECNDEVTDRDYKILCAECAKLLSNNDSKDQRLDEEFGKIT